ncbi:MAG: ATPase P [Rhodospirillaceae bacterium]|nr:MAG: ATPase P [Rhodospirillaceae bacterium]
MARISRTIREALGRLSQIQCLSRQMADRRVMITLLSGAMMFALTRDWQRLESVFLVGYACAVKFGTPIAFKAASCTGWHAWAVWSREDRRSRTSPRWTRWCSTRPAAHGQYP